MDGSGAGVRREPPVSVSWPVLATAEIYPARVESPHVRPCCHGRGAPERPQSRCELDGQAGRRDAARGLRTAVRKLDALLEALIGAGRELSESRPGVGAIAGASGRVLAAASAHRHLEVDELRRLIGEEANGIPREPSSRRSLDRDPAPGPPQGRRRPHALGLRDGSRGSRSHAGDSRDLHRLGAGRRGSRLRGGLRGEGLERRPRRGCDAPAVLDDATIFLVGADTVFRRDPQQQDRHDGAGRSRGAASRPSSPARSSSWHRSRQPPPEPNEAERALFELTPPELLSEIVTEEGPTPTTASARSSTARPSCARATRRSCPRKHSRQVRLAVLAFVAFVATGCMSRRLGQGRGGTAAPRDLRHARGESPTKLWTLRCPGGGDAARPTRACARLAGLEDPFAPVPRTSPARRSTAARRKPRCTGRFAGADRRLPTGPTAARSPAGTRFPLPRHLRWLCASRTARSTWPGSVGRTCRRCADAASTRDSSSSTRSPSDPIRPTGT